MESSKSSRFLITARTTALISAAALLWAALSVVLTYYQMTNTQMLTEPRVRLTAYLNGDIARPFAYRKLLPATIRAGLDVNEGIAALAPSLQLERLGAPICSRLSAHLPHALGPGECAAHLLLAGILCTSLFAFAIGLYAIYRRLHPEAGPYGLLAPLVALAAVSAIESLHYGHIYDFSVLALTTWSLYFLLVRRFWAFLLIFAVGCFNKETALLLTITYVAVCAGHRPAREIAMRFSALCFVFAAIYGMARLSFAHNPGAPMENWGVAHLQWILDWGPAQWLGAVVVIFSLRFNWNHQPQFLKRASIVFAPHLALCFFGAQPGEIRNFYEVLPLAILLWSGNLATAWTWLAHAPNTSRA